MSASSCMSDEGGEHEGIWMAFRASPQIWGKKRVAEVQADLLKIALTIAKYEPVFMIVSPEDHPRLSSMLQGQEAKPTHKIHVMKHLLDDLWIRDSGAIFTVRGETEGEDSQTPAEASPLRAVKFNFNGWGKKQAHSRDATVADVMARSLGVPLVPSRLVLEGGGIEVDGEGTAIITQSCVLNANRNPKLSKESAETELKKLLGLEKIIWLPGIAGEDITDGHTDFYARFASPGNVVASLDDDPSSFDKKVTESHLKILEKETDAKGRRLNVTVLPVPSRTRRTSEYFAAGYVNFLVLNGAVLVPEFGDPKADGHARDQLSRLFPGRVVEQLNIDAIADGGGGIHCATMQQPKVKGVSCVPAESLNSGPTSVKVTESVGGNASDYCCVLH